MAGKTIKLFLADGKPNGLTIAELQQWTGIALACPRSELPKLVQRPEAIKPGVYVLTGQDEESQLPVAYIGEAENICTRLKEHHRTSDFWDRICFFTQKDDNLTKGHIRYLEARMIQVALEAKRMPLRNGSSPSPTNIPLPESDLADMEYFLEQMQMLLPVLGIDLLKPQPTVQEKVIPENAAESPLFVLTSRGVKATAQIVENEFVVIKDSLAAKKTIPIFDTLSCAKAREKLLESGVLVDAGKEHYRFSQNYSFTSPSSAASVVAGGSINGRTEWKVQDSNETYAEWDEARMNVLQNSPCDKNGG